MSTMREKLRMAFWIVPLCLQPLIAIAIATRRQVRTFPLFFVYTLFVSTRDLALLFIKHYMRIYSWVYFLSEPLAIVLGVAVIYEVSWHQIRSYSPLRSLDNVILSPHAAGYSIEAMADLRVDMGNTAAEWAREQRRAKSSASATSHGCG